MTTKLLLKTELALMLALLGAGVFFPQAFTRLLSQPPLYIHVKFVHILAVTLFFANAVIGTIWETRSLLQGTPEIIRYTYRTVVWLDAVFTAPLILISVLSGIMLATILGGVGTIGWISNALYLFLFSGAVWIAADIPTQYRINRHFEALPADATALPRPLTRLLWWRLAISAAGTLPLLVIFYLMIHKPDLPTVAHWLGGRP